MKKWDRQERMRKRDGHDGMRIEEWWIGKNRGKQERMRKRMVIGQEGIRRRIVRMR
jgi:hypothetical protein